MKSTDLEYIYSNIPHANMNKYPHGLQRNTMLQYVDYLKENEYKHYVKLLKKGNRSITFKRDDGSNINTLKNPVYPNNSQAGRKVAIENLKLRNI